VPIHRHLLVVAAVCGVGTVVLAMAVAGQSGAPGPDATVAGWVEAHEPMPYQVAQALDVVGTAPVATPRAVVVAAACLFARHRRGAVLALAGPALAVAVTSVLKPLVGRTIHGDNLAFPSGHAAVATALLWRGARRAPGAPRLRAPGARPLGLGAARGGGGGRAGGRVTLMAHCPSGRVGGSAVAFCVVGPAGRVGDLSVDGRTRRRQR